jgi:hypothetical protein
VFLASQVTLVSLRSEYAGLQRVTRTEAVTQVTRFERWHGTNAMLLRQTRQFEADAFSVDTTTTQSAPYAREDEMSEQTHSSTATHRLSRRPRRTPSADRRSSGRLTPPTRPEWRDELRAWMRAGGWTIERLSRQLDCATSTVCAWLYSPRRSGLPRRPSPDLEARLMELGGPRP